MPSRPALAAILAFWVLTTGFVIRREVLPHLGTGEPPALGVELVDEANPTTTVRWGVYRGDKHIGRLTTRTEHVAANDTFRLIHDYQHLEFEFGPTRVVVPKLSTTTRVTRAGELREQSMTGRIEVHVSGGTLDADAEVHGRVENGAFRGRCDIRSPLGDVNQDLDPVDVPNGHAISPLQVQNRITGLRAGQTWEVREIDPLGDAVAALAKAEVRKLGLAIPERKRERIIAEVGSSPEPLAWRGGEVACWVIEYRARDAKAKTWVRAADGKVLRQEAFGLGEKLAVVREE
ncbi:MAG: hypothetical protein K2P78_00705 [Gemmataceae bacterium]|nr:hypothetical protein [Gemmataceae bacterium]